MAKAVLVLVVAMIAACASDASPGPGSTDADGGVGMTPDGAAGGNPFAEAPCDSSWRGAGAPTKCDVSCSSYPIQHGDVTCKRSENPNYTRSTTGGDSFPLGCAGGFESEGVKGCCQWIQGDGESKPSMSLFFACVP